MVDLASILNAATTTTTAASHKSSGSILDPIAKPIASLLAGFYSIIPNYGVAILLLSVLWMLIISPLTLKSTRSMLAMQKLAPELKKLQEQHRNDRAALSQATMDLYKEHNVSPFGSCLPSILPLPVFIALFRVIDGLSHVSHGVASPKYLSHGTQMYKDIVTAGGHLHAFGLDLSKNALSSHSGVGSALPFWLLLLIMGGTQWFQTQQMMSRNQAAAQNSQMQIMKYLPLLFTLICIRFPAGVVLYYAMSNVCRIVQQDLMYRFDPKVKTLVAQEVIEVEAKTRDINRGKGGSGAAAVDSGRGPAAGGSSGGRGRFRELLAGAVEQAAEQRAAKDQTKSNGGTATPSRSGSRTAKSARSGSASPQDRKPSPAKGNGARADSGGGADSVDGGNSGGGANSKGGASSGSGTKSGSGTRSSSGKGGPARAGTGRPGGGRTGAGQSSTGGPGRPAPRGHRTNRKRRGR